MRYQPPDFLKIPQNQLMYIEKISEKTQQRLEEEHGITITHYPAIPTIAHAFLYEAMKFLTMESVEKLSPDNPSMGFNLMNTIMIGIREEGAYNFKPFVKLADDLLDIVKKHGNKGVDQVEPALKVTSEQIAEFEDDKMIPNEILKAAIEKYGINIEDHRHKFPGGAVGYNNMVTAFNSGHPLSFMMFKRWCDTLGLKLGFNLSI